MDYKYGCLFDYKNLSVQKSNSIGVFISEILLQNLRISQKSIFQGILKVAWLLFELGCKTFLEVLCNRGMLTDLFDNNFNSSHPFTVLVLHDLGHVHHHLLLLDT